MDDEKKKEHRLKMISLVIAIISGIVSIIVNIIKIFK